MRTVRLLAVMLGILVLLAAIGLGLLASGFDSGRLKEEIAGAVLEKKGRSLKIDGDLGLTFFPGPGLEIGPAVLSERGSERPFARVGGVRVVAQWAPLLAGRVAIERIEVRELQVSLVRYRDGTFNFSDLLSPSEEEGFFGKSDIGALALADSALIFTDEKSGQSVRLTDLALETGYLAKAATGSLRMSCAAAQAERSLNARLRLGADYRFNMDRKQFGLQGVRLTARGAAFNGEGMELSLGADDMTLAADRSELRISGLDLGARAQLRNGLAEARMEFPFLTVSAGRVSGETAAGIVKLSGKDRQVDGKMQLSGIEGGGSGLRVAGLMFQAHYSQGGLQAEGAVSGPLEAVPAAGRVTLPKLAGNLAISHPKLSGQPIQLLLQARIETDLAKSAAAGELSTALDGSPIRAKWQGFWSPRPAVDFEVLADRLDAGRYLPSAPPRAGRGKAPATPPDGAGDQAFPKEMEVNGTARIGFLRLGTMTAKGLRADIRIRNGQAVVNSSSARGPRALSSSGRL